MNLSTDLISQFAKITNDGKDKKKETTVYGTTVENEGVIYVKLDGSNLLTPVLSAADTKANERVIVMIKNHTATITGNLSSPAARYDDVKNVVDIPERMTRVELEMDDKINKEDGMGLSQENFTTEEKDKLSKLENYDDTELSSRVGVLETNLGGHTVKSDVPANAVFTDTVYDDTELLERVSNVERDYSTKEYVAEQIAGASHLTREIVTSVPTSESAKENVIYMLKVNDSTGPDIYQEYQKIGTEVVLIGDTSVDLTDYAKKDDLPESYDDSKLSSRVGVLETNLGGHTVKSDVPANAVFTDTVYDDTELSNRVKTIENDYAKSEDIPIVTNDLTDELKTKYDKAVEDIEGLKESPLPNITEQGAIGIWTYTKWANDDVELWGVYEVTNSICNTPLGGIYFTDIDNSVKFGGMFRTGVFEPDAFPFEVYNAKLVSSYESDAQGAILWAVTSTTSKKPPNYYLVRPTISTIESGKIIFHVVGKLTV